MHKFKYHLPTLRILFGSSNVMASGRFMVNVLLPGRVPSMSISASVTLSSLNISSKAWKSITCHNSKYTSVVCGLQIVVDWDPQDVWRLRINCREKKL